MTRSRLHAALLGVLAALGLPACFMIRRTPPPGATGEVIYRYQNCANCHADKLEGSQRGPALAGLAAHWTRESLSAFLDDPRPFLERDERLQELARAHDREMSRYDNLTLEQRQVLADWLLAR